MFGSSTLLTRLALALLAVLGFVAPLSVPEGDRVVQTAGGKPSPAAKVELRRVPALTLETKTPHHPASQHPTVARVELGARRYLLNRAWLV